MDQSVEEDVKHIAQHRALYIQYNRGIDVVVGTTAPHGVQHMRQYSTPSPLRLASSHFMYLCDPGGCVSHLADRHRIHWKNGRATRVFLKPAGSNQASVRKRHDFPLVCPQ